MAYKASPNSKAASGGKRRVTRIPTWTPQERIFAAAVLRHGNKSKAAREAHPHINPEQSHLYGHQMYSRPHVRGYIQDENLNILNRQGDGGKYHRRTC